jgi:hypothetical protein
MRWWSTAASASPERRHDIRRAFLAPPYPVTTTVAVARLYDGALMVEIGHRRNPLEPLQAA